MFVRVGKHCGPGRSRLSSLSICLIGTVLAVGVSLATVPLAQAGAAFSAITVDAHNGRVIFAKNADEPRYPASLTKIMTLYLLFQDMEAGRIGIESRFRVSRRAAARQPSKLGLRPGSSIKVRTAIKALVTKSANDVATAVAEGLERTEEAFARRMTRTARAIGMSRTVFTNASGLPDRRQRTTARDMATLGLRIQKDFPKFYKYFRLRSFTYKGRRHKNHNLLLGRFRGTDGIKTGYTRASGYNLTSSVRRKGRHVVGVVMGARSGKSRNRYMAGILESALKRVPYRRRPLLASAAGTPPRDGTNWTTRRVGADDRTFKSNVGAARGRNDGGARVVGAGVDGTNWTGTNIGTLVAALASSDAGTGMARGETWQIQIGAFKSADDALVRLSKVRNTGPKSLRGKKAMTLAVDSNGSRLYRARFAGFSRRQAAQVCRYLSRRSIDCLTIAPKS